MRLSELEPHWIGVYNASPGSVLDQVHIGVAFWCPHCRATRLAVLFRNPVGPPLSDWPHVGLGDKFWERQGETFEDLTLTPSIDCSKSGHWHGFVTAGDVT